MPIIANQFEKFLTLNFVGTRIAAMAVALLIIATACTTVVPAAIPTSVPAASPPMPSVAVIETPEPSNNAAETEDANVAINPIFQELNPTGPKEFNIDDLEQLLEADFIEPIYTPFVGNPDDVDLEPSDLVIGVHMNGESRAYPIRVLRFREMVNDEIGGVPILVTW